eukprot:g6256.t1
MKTSRAAMCGVTWLRYSQSYSRVARYRLSNVTRGHSQRSLRGSSLLLMASTLTEIVPYEVTPRGTPLPKDFTKIQTLKQSDLKKNGRLIIIGDVHGCYKDFCKLIDELKFDADKDNLVMAGDLVNKGPDSLKVIRKAMKIGAFVVRGNHEDSALAAYYDDLRGEEIPPKFEWVKDLKKKHLKFLESLPFAISIPSYKLIVVHAGLVPETTLTQQDMFSMYKMRDLKKCEIRNSWIPLERGTEESTPWASQWQGPEHVIFGHDSTRRLQLHPFATGIDTGAVQGGQLSACVFPPVGKIPSPDGPAFRENLGMKIMSIEIEESRKVVYPKPLPEVLVSSINEAENLCMEMYASFDIPRQPQTV